MTVDIECFIRHNRCDKFLNRKNMYIMQIFICKGSFHEDKSESSFYLYQLVVSMLLDVQFSMQYFVDHFSFFWPLYCLYFFYLWILITPLVSSNFSYKNFTFHRLKNLGTEMNLSNSMGRTALHAAAENGMEDIVKYLLNDCEVSSFVRMK